MIATALSCKMPRDRAWANTVNRINADFKILFPFDQFKKHHSQRVEDWLKSKGQRPKGKRPMKKTKKKAKVIRVHWCVEGFESGTAFTPKGAMAEIRRVKAGHTDPGLMECSMTIIRSDGSKDKRKV